MEDFLLYTYNARCTEVYDGDTITVDIDLGFRTYLKKIKIRLSDINCPEMRGSTRESAIVVRDIVRSRILNKDIVIHTKKMGAFGRWLGTIYYDDNGRCKNLNGQLLVEGNATKYEK